jgi:hypothetical protein
MSVTEPIDILSGYIHLTDLARELRCGVRTVVRYEHQPDGLPSVTIAGRRYYKISEVRAWVDRRTRQAGQPR